jgi:ParB/RepB/Spo0J family partition protein
MNNPLTPRQSLADLAPEIDILTELLTGNVETTAATADITAIIEDPEQPRRDFDQGALEELADSIRAHGVLQPLLVRKKDQSGQYRLVAGARRFRAAKLAGLTRVPIQVTSTDQVFAVQMVENLQRSDLAPLEIADAIKELVGAGRSQADIGKALGKSKTWVSRYAAIAEMPDDLRLIVTARGCDDYSALSQLLKSYLADQAGTLNALQASSGPITRQIASIPAMPASHEYLTVGVGVAHAQLNEQPHLLKGVAHEQLEGRADNEGESDASEGQGTPAHAAKVTAPKPRWNWAVHNRPVEPSFSMMPSDQGMVWVKDIGTKAPRLVKAGDLKLVGAELV